MTLSAFSERLLRIGPKDLLKQLVLEAIRLCWTGQIFTHGSETISQTHTKMENKDNFKPLRASRTRRKVKWWVQEPQQAFTVIAQGF